MRSELHHPSSVESLLGDMVWDLTRLALGWHWGGILISLLHPQTAPTVGNLPFRPGVAETYPGWPCETHYWHDTNAAKTFICC